MVRNLTIYRIFKNSSLDINTHFYYTPNFIVLAYMTVTIALLAVMTLGSGPLGPTVIQNDTIPTLKIIQCLPPSRALYWSIFTVMTVMLFATLIFCAYLAYQTRYVDSAFNESFYLALTSYILLEIALFFMPIHYIAYTYNSGDFLSLRGLFLGLCLWVFIYFFFITKMISIVREEDQLSAEDRQMLQDLNEIDLGEDDLMEADEERFQRLFQARQQLRGTRAAEEYRRHPRYMEEPDIQRDPDYDPIRDNIYDGREVVTRMRSNLNPIPEE